MPVYVQTMHPKFQQSNRMVANHPYKICVRCWVYVSVTFICNTARVFIVVVVVSLLCVQLQNGSNSSDFLDDFVIERIDKANTHTNLPEQEKTTTQSALKLYAR